MRRAAAFLLLTLGFLAPLAPTTAQTSVQLRFVGPDDGLPNARVYSIAQDSMGYIWVGTPGGVARHDGVRFRTWRSSPGGLPSTIAYAVHVDAEGTVWAGTGRGIARFDPVRGQFVAFAMGGTAVRYLASDAGGLWASTPAGIFRVRSDGSSRQALGDVVVTFVSAGGIVWSRGCRLGAATPPACLAPTGPPSIRAAWTRGAHVYTVDTDGIVREETPARRRVATWDAAMFLPYPSALWTPGRVWLASEMGLVIYDPVRGQSSRVGPASGLHGTNVETMHRDRQGGVWIGTEQGLHRWTPPRSGLSAVSLADGLPDDRVNGIATLGADTWIATKGGLFQRTSDGRFRSFLAGDDLAENAVWRVAPAVGGGLWLGGKRFGLRRLWPETGRIVRIDEPAELLSPSRDLSVAVRTVGEHGGRLWVGTSTGMAVRDAEGRWNSYTMASHGLPDNAVNDIYRDRRGRTWLATDGGVARFDPDTESVRLAGAGTDLEGAVSWHIAETPDDPGALYVATVDGAGLCRYDPETDDATCLTTADGLPSDIVRRIETGDGALWLGTDRGLARLDVHTRTVTTFTEADGLHSDEVDFMSSTRGADGTIYMGGPGGYTAFRPGDIRPSAYRPRVRISSVEAGGRTLAQTDVRGVRLRRGARSVAVSFAALDYTRPVRNRFRFRLWPLEETWTLAGASASEARYAALPPGEYRLDVQGSNHAGVFSSHVARLRVSVPPVWWERRGAQATGVLLLLGMAAAGARMRVSMAERRRADAAEVSRRLEASREAERTRVARELHDGAMQHLYRVGHDLDRLATVVPAPDRPGVVEARSSLDDAANDLRGVLSGIRLPHVGTFGAAAAIRAVTERFEQTCPDVAVTLDLRAEGRRWPVEVQHAVARIVQEALANVHRHAEASAVRVSLSEDAGRVTVEVTDDGRGFAAVRDVDLVRGNHYGLAGLRERAEGLGGRAEITSAPGAGTRVCAVVPVD